MIRSLRTIAAAVAIALSLVACGRLAASSTPTVPNVYAGAVRLSDIASSLGDSSNWWPGPPQFGTRPLDSSTRPDEERFDLTLRFTHNGTAETLDVVYRVWSSSSLATAIMSSAQSALGTSLTGPSAGDQVLYYNQKLGFGAAPYVSETLIRVGQMVVTVVWSRAAAFASTNAEGAIAKRVVSKLKGSLSGGIHASPAPAPDPHFMPPDGTDLTQLGTDTLPIEVLVQMVASAEPNAVEGIFKRLGASDFVFGDYALNSDTHMEVESAAITFPSPAAGTDWLNQWIGAANLDQSGGYFNYDDVTGQYILAFAVGTTGVVMICRSAADLEAASRACETPMGRAASAWRVALGG
ncbi:MAG TPA: hypothetical protein VEU76_00010 [Candidatus Udaeobacter sp.]|nr:hypothetical protein [Candidatus Udaeobacter sp.]